MLGTLPPLPHVDRPELPRVRLDVRAAGAAAGRAVSYEVGAAEFLIGGADGCDLRLPVPNLPPVVAQLVRKPDAVRVRRLTPILPVLLNGQPLPANAPTAVATGDVLALAGIEIVVAIQPSALVAARFVAVAEEPVPGQQSQPQPVPVAEPVELPVPQYDDAELIRRARELDRQTEELESDRVAWYRRRQEMEAEFERHRAVTAESEARQQALDAREAELNRFRDDLAAIREGFLKEYQDRRADLAAQQAELEQRRGAFEGELRDRRTQFEAELAALAAASEAEAHARFRDQFEELERQRESTRKIVADAEAEAARRRDAVAAEVAAYEPKLRELREQQDRLAAAFQELARQRDLFAADRSILDRAKETFEASKLADTDRLTGWEKQLADRDADLVARQERFAEDLAALNRDRTQFQDDLVRLERRTAAVEEQERRSAERAREIDVRLEQLRRDSAEWEETVRLVAAEEERLRAEAERLDRQKADLDAQSATLAERAGQLEAQQAVLGVLRAKLDRTRQEAEREVAQLAAARTREDESLADLRARIAEAEELRARLATVQADTAKERDRLDERDSLLQAGLDEIRTQREALAAEAQRLREREADLDSRSTEFAEQAGTLKGRVSQAFDLQARLEADRVALREREAALAQAEEARQALQEQLRRRAEDLTARAKTLDELARTIATERAAIDQGRADTEATRLVVLDELDQRRKQLDERAAEIDRLAADYADKEQALARQIGRLKDVGAAVAAERKSLAESRTKWEAERAAAAADTEKAQQELAAFRAQALAEIEALRGQAPELEAQATGALERLASARDMLRGHLTELHDFARLSREDLAAIRAQVRQEAERLREQEEALNRAKAEHRLAVTAFRQQLIDWQGQVGDMKRTLASSESRIDAKQAAAETAAKQADAVTVQLAEQAEQLRREREAVAERRTEVERHLGDMREWYRKKLRELAVGNAERGTRNAELEAEAVAGPRLAELGDSSDPVPQAPHTPSVGGPAPRIPHSELELEPGDRQLGELLRSHALVDAETLTALWAEAGRQRRTLRQVLLASGAVTLYQLALIEAGNLDALMVGRFRVIDRLRVTPKEAIYRVFDPSRGTGAGVHLLRHLSEAEMQDAVHPDEFRQRFAAARDAAHPNLAAVEDVLEIGGRPAVLQEWLTGLFSADWPAQAGHPGCWVRLATMAAAGIESAHRHGLVHGRLTSDSFVLTADGALKVTGFGEPPFLSQQPPPADLSVAADLRAFGQVLFGWSQLAAKQKRPGKPKPFPDALLAIVRRLEADAEPPMADTVAADRPYESATEVLADLQRAARDTGFSDDAWEKLLKYVADNAPDSPVGLKRSA
ncbi:serine threonine protein kinase-like protein : [Gemmataceae bacterium]|nr:serine threonine protein kinase-like protein : [Gemmataceae bacterium]VTT96696.1 serine threonine protein kinase-like protein : [Gemmataceae bacterium]